MSTRPDLLLVDDDPNAAQVLAERAKTSAAKLLPFGEGGSGQNLAAAAG